MAGTWVSLLWRSDIEWAHGYGRQAPHDARGLDILCSQIRAVIRPSLLESPSTGSFNRITNVSCLTGLAFAPTESGGGEATKGQEGHVLASLSQQHRTLPRLSPPLCVSILYSFCFSFACCCSWGMCRVGCPEFRLSQIHVIFNFMVRPLRITNWLIYSHRPISTSRTPAAPAEWLASVRPSFTFSMSKRSRPWLHADEREIKY